MDGTHALLGASALVPPGVILMAAPTIDELRQRQQDITAESQALIETADKDERDLTDEEIATIEANKTEVEKIGRQITARESVTVVAQGQGRKTTAEVTNKGADGKAERRIPATVRDNARHNFVNLGEFAQSVRLQSIGGVENEGVKKLLNAATTYGNEGAGAEGGFLVPPEFSRTLWQKCEAEENLMTRCAQLTPMGNSMAIPKDETTPWGTAGIRVYWDGEAAAITQSRPAFELSTLRLHKLTALVPASDELLEDASGYESFLMAKVPGIMAHTINDKILDGTGVGMPLGLLKSPSLISVAKETSQPADSIWKANIDKMWSRLYAPWRRNAVWLINQDAEPALEAMGYSPSGVVPTAASMPVYLPPGGVADAPYARLKGRPVIPLQACKTVGDQGDILLIDFNQYWVLRKASGLKVDTSIHLFFDQAATAFRFLFRINGQPAWSAAITPQNGSNTLSWAVALEAR